MGAWNFVKSADPLMLAFGLAGCATTTTFTINKEQAKFIEEFNGHRTTGLIQEWSNVRGLWARGVKDFGADSAATIADVLVAPLFVAVTPVAGLLDLFDSWRRVNEQEIDAAIIVQIIQQDGKPLVDNNLIKLDGSPISPKNDGRLRVVIHEKTQLTLGNQQWEEELRRVGRSIRVTPSSVTFSLRKEGAAVFRVDAEADGHPLGDFRTIRVMVEPLKDKKRMAEVAKEKHEQEIASRNAAKKMARAEAEFKENKFRQHECDPGFLYALLCGVRETIKRGGSMKPLLDLAEIYSSKCQKQGGDAYIAEIIRSCL